MYFKSRSTSNSPDGYRTIYSNSVMYVNNIEPEMVLPPGSESFNHNATRTTSSRSRSNNVNNNTVCVYCNSKNMMAKMQHVFDEVMFVIDTLVIL